MMAMYTASFCINFTFQFSVPSLKRSQTRDTMAIVADLEAPPTGSQQQHTHGVTILPCSHDSPLSPRLVTPDFYSGLIVTHRGPGVTQAFSVHILKAAITHLTVSESLEASNLYFVNF